MNRPDSRLRPILRVRDLGKSFGDLQVIRGVNLTVRPGEVVVIMGPSGAGKSTFLRCLNFLEEPSQGMIEINGIEVHADDNTGRKSKRVQEIRRTAAMVFQDFNLFPHLNVLDNIIIGAVNAKGLPKKQAIAKAEQLLADMDLLARRADFPSQLAAGERQKVAIARSLCLEPQILLFDDPTSALDPASVVGLVALMEGLAKDGIALIIVSNNPYLTTKVAGWVILMDEGVWLEKAPPDKLFSHPEKERTRQFLSSILLKGMRGGISE